MFKFSFNRRASTKVRVRGQDTLKMPPRPVRDWWWRLGGWCVGLVAVVVFGWYLTYQANDVERVSLAVDELEAIPSPNSRRLLDSTIKIIKSRETAYQQALTAPAPADPAR
jgi:hypothetical protein